MIFGSGKKMSLIMAAVVFLVSMCVAFLPLMAEASEVSGIPANIKAKTVTATGTVTASEIKTTKACAAGYVRMWVGYCMAIPEVPMGSVPTTCTLKAAPSPNAKVLNVRVIIGVASTNSVVRNSQSINFHDNAGCLFGSYSVGSSFSAYEFVATTAGTMLAYATNYEKVPLSVVGGSYYVIAYPLQANSQYMIIGYWD